MAIAVTARTQVPAKDELAYLADSILQQHELCKVKGREMVEHAILAGEALNRAKELVPRGEWEDWLVERFPAIGLSMPRVYMRLAKHADYLRRNGELPLNLRAASRELDVYGPTSEPDETLISRAIAMRKRGTKYKDIAEELGVSIHKAYRWANPSYEEKRKSKLMGERRALARLERDKDVKKAGGSAAQAYALVRRALQALEEAPSENRRQKRAISDAMHRLYDAEEAIAASVRAEGAA